MYAATVSSEWASGSDASRRPTRGFDEGGREDGVLGGAGEEDAPSQPRRHEFSVTALLVRVAVPWQFWCVALSAPVRCTLMLL